METLRPRARILNPRAAARGLARFELDQTYLRLSALIEEALSAQVDEDPEHLMTHGGVFDASDFVYTPLPRHWVRRSQNEVQLRECARL
jgi:hypothetical protein